jgi:hypothetical protein
LLSAGVEVNHTTFGEEAMRCKSCNCWIYKGFEVLYRDAYYHAECAVEAVKMVVRRRKKSKFRLIRGKG